MTSNLRLSTSAPSPHPWNGTGVRSRFFDALSLLLPGGEQFLIETLESWRASAQLGPGDELGGEIDRFIREEQAHRRAHANYNAALVDAVPHMQPLVERANAITADLAGFSAPMKLALVVAFEHLTAVLAEEIEAHPFLLVRNDSRAARLWRWHAREELGHRHVAVCVANRAGIGRGALTLALLLATLYLATDLLRYTFALCRCDVRAGASRATLIADSVRFAGGAIPSLLRMARHWFGLLLSPTRCAR
ncbi:metal-dependent hydrolase [Trinickia dabaoshanensis]|uniref:Metal-dependent hydrolase n=1 Tax=Trinickia dabaoshanensis TaxID=564714 RepID=A0A2N7VY24_9BURK|nr:metal-dependent hydrolase [Trinickia dabaoshanensis]PMS22030.1 metal-dependent hydrolase [Trinickia dabaoshanensis]